MAEEQNKEAAGEGEAESSKKGLPVMTIAVVLVVVVIEAVTISAVFILAGGPDPVDAGVVEIDPAAGDEKPVELLVVKGKFQNTRSGRAYLYDTTVYIVIKAKHKDETEALVEAMSAQIQTDVARIFRKADPSYLLEPELSTLTRQIQARLDERLGVDEEGESLIMEVLVPTCKRFRSDM